MGPVNKDDDKLTLSYVLNLIDGLHEQNGRVIIMTSNHPEKLDRALIRPGRIDMKINFSKCTPEIIREMLEFYFEILVPPEIQFPDQVYTPAEVFQMCQNLEDPPRCWELLQNPTPLEIEY